MTRPKGIPNRSSTEFREALAKINFSIPEEAAKLYRECQREDIKQKILDMMAKYSHPTFKPVDEHGSANDPIMHSLLAAIPSSVLIEVAKRQLQLQQQQSRESLPSGNPEPGSKPMA